MLCIHVVSLALRLRVASPGSSGSLSAYSHNVSTITLMNNIHALILYLAGRRETEDECSCDAARKQNQSNPRRPTL